MRTLQVEQLSIERGDRSVLSGLSFCVEPGQIVHVVGRNGAGKTSLLEALCGLRIARSGRIDAQPLPGERHWIGHRNGLSAALSPLENLQFWAGLEGTALGVQAATASLQRVGLHAQRYRPCGTLSTGQKRRAALARLLAIQRPWWFLDEPLAGLDTAGIEIFATLLATHAATGGTAMISSHQPLPPGACKLRTLALDQ